MLCAMKSKFKGDHERAFLAAFECNLIVKAFETEYAECVLNVSFWAEFIRTKKKIAKCLLTESKFIDYVDKNEKKYLKGRLEEAMQAEQVFGDSNEIARRFGYRHKPVKPPHSSVLPEDVLKEIQHDRERAAQPKQRPAGDDQEELEDIFTSALKRHKEGVSRANAADDHKAQSYSAYLEYLMAPV